MYTEPDPHMAKRLRRRGVEVIEAGEESLPFAGRDVRRGGVDARALHGARCSSDRSPRCAAC